MAAIARRARRRNGFFVWTAAAMLVVVALGFGKSFYVRPLFNDNPLPGYLVVHGLTLTAWYLLFLAQAGLVKAGRTDLHRRLGVAGVLVAVAVVLTSAVVHLNLIPRRAALGHITTAEELTGNVRFVLGGLSSLVPFVVLIGLAVWWRRKVGIHKRLMFWAFVWTLGPAASGSRPLGRALDSLVAPHLPWFPLDLLWLVALVVYDWRTERRIHPATYVGFLALAVYLFVVTEWIIGVPVLQEWLKATVGER